MERINGSSGNHQLPESLILQVKFSIKPQTTCQKKNLKIPLYIDNNAEVVATVTVSEICGAVANDKSKLAEESELNCTRKEEQILEAPPIHAQMREALQIIRRVQHTATTSKGIMSMSNSVRNYNNNNRQQFISFLK
jgi:enamine deaminase RidA (YjgF/YER057c/UK114 family)